MQPQHLTPVNVADLPEYPVAADERLESHYFIELHFRRWLTSETRLLADLDVRSVILDMFMIAQDQTPVGTLPLDDRLLAKLLGLEITAWRELCARDVPPLRHWVRCRAGEAIRLMHPVVTEMVIAATGRRRDREAENARRRDAKRLKDLRERLAAMGNTHVVKSTLMVERIDTWLTKHCLGNRTEDWILRALEEASAPR